jgi:hypothetical protein
VRRIEGRAANAAIDSYWKEAQEATDRRSVFDRLAAIRDPSAALAAARLAERCHLYADNTFASTLKRIDQGAQSPTTKAAQKAVAQRERAKCVGFTSERFAKTRDLEKYVYEVGDPRGLRYDLPINGAPIPKRIAMAQAAARTDDPAALDEVGMFFASRSDVRKGAMFDLGNGVGVSSGMIRDAFFLAACSYGDDCGAASEMVTARCVVGGYCEATTLEESLMRYGYTPAEADKLNAAVTVVLDGVKTGAWPADFWSTPH